MRSRIAAALLAACAAAAPASAAAAAVYSAPGARSSVVGEETGAASWMFPTGRPGRSTWFFGGAYRSSVVGGKTVTIGFVVKGRCKTGQREGASVTACRGTGTGGEIPAERFQVDPALRRGSLVIRDGRRRHEIAWNADEAPPATYLAGEACNQGTGEGAGFLQHATATGTLFGRRLAADGVDHAILTRGAMVTQCTEAYVSERLARRAAAGKPVRVVFR